MSEQTFETFDALYKTLHRQGRRVEELENRIEVLEREILKDVSPARPLLSMDSARRCERIGKGEE